MAILRCVETYVSREETRHYAYVRAIVEVTGIRAFNHMYELAELKEAIETAREGSEEVVLVVRPRVVESSSQPGLEPVKVGFERKGEWVTIREI